MEMVYTELRLILFILGTKEVLGEVEDEKMGRREGDGDGQRRGPASREACKPPSDDAR
jgi:hypothetical protein